jgi:hypothetical protein
MNEIRAAQEELSKTFGEAGQSFYAQSQGAADAGQGGGHGRGAGRWAPPPSRRTTSSRADYEIVDEAKK